MHFLANVLIDLCKKTLFIITSFYTSGVAFTINYITHFINLSVMAAIDCHQ